MAGNRFLEQIEEPKGKTDNRFLKGIETSFPEGEKGAKSLLRTFLQPVLGYAKRYTYPLDLFKLASEGASRNVLAELAEEEPELRGGVAEQARQKSMGYLPTQELAEELIEEKSGVPLTPKTELQKKARLAGTAAGFRQGGLAAKSTAALAAPLIATGLEKVGAPESIAEIGGLLASGAVPSAQVSKVTKPSGMSSRFFEKVKKPIKVSPGRHEKINEALEGDFRDISDRILSKNPDYKSIKEDPSYRENLNEAFDKVTELADQIPETVHQRHLLSFMKRRARVEEREMKGITPSESEETFRKEFGGLMHKVSDGPTESSISHLVDQFRKNNSELAAYFEPGKSKSYNTGKRDALLEYNRSIQELFETVHPNSEFAKIFREQNKKWSQLSDVDFIEGKLNKIFEGGKIDFPQVAKLMDKSKENLRRPFRRIMGKDGFKDFEALLKDFISVKSPYALLKKAEIAGFKDLAKLAGSYIIHPNLAKLQASAKILKNATRMLLDKPQLSVKWKSAFDNLKAGNYEKAQEEFQALDSEAKAISEKVKPFQSKARVVPEGYSPEFGHRVFEENPRYFANPHEEELAEYRMKEPTELLSEKQFGRYFGRNNPPPTPQEQVLYERSWPTLMKKDSYNSYYEGKPGESIGKLGDFLKNPKIRSMYSDVLDTEVRISQKNPYYNTEAKAIYMPPNIAPQEFYQALMHESHHALQDYYNRLVKYPYYAHHVDTREKYLKHPIEARARLAARYAAKDLQKARKTTQKMRKLGEKVQERRKAGTHH
jgi:hypothetical protein